VSVGDEIEYALLFRIRSGQYKAGSRLPSVRDLAREFGVNKNTIARAHQSLVGKGHLRSVSGKGMYVVESANSEASATAMHEQLGAQLSALVWRAKLLGLAAVDVSALFERIVGSAYASSSVRLVFVECCDYDAQRLARQLGDFLGTPLRPALLADLADNPGAVLGDADIVVTSFYHLAAVRAVVEAAFPAVDVVGIHAPPEQESLLRIARVPQGSRVLIVCTEDTTLHTITNQVRAYNASLKVATHLLGRDELACDLQDADYVVDTQTSHPALLAAACAAPIITLAFAVDRQSLEFLRGRVMGRMGQPVAETLPI
jgi:GntR family transcriptional regulator